MNVHSEFNINDMVKIKPLDFVGKIVCFSFDGVNLEIKIKYYNGGRVEFDWFFEDELVKFNPNKNTFGYAANRNCSDTGEGAKCAHEKEVNETITKDEEKV